METDATGPEPGGLEPDPAERLRQLEEEVQRLKQQMQPAPEEPSSAPQPEDVPPAGDEEPEPRELTAAEQAEIDNLIKQAQLARIRKQSAQATDLLKKAVALAPGSAIVLEALGDDLMDRRIYKSAKEAYGKALKLDPTNVALDKKYGQAVFESDARAAGVMMDFQDDNWAGGNASIWLSLFLPGVGQMVRGKWIKGTIILAGVFVSLAILIFMRSGDAKQTQDAKFTMLIPLGSAFAFWIWGFLDTQSGAKHVGKRQINRPLPPVDLPFE